MDLILRYSNGFTTKKGNGGIICSGSTGVPRRGRL